MAYPSFSTPTIYGAHYQRQGASDAGEYEILLDSHRWSSTSFLLVLRSNYAYGDQVATTLDHPKPPIGWDGAQATRTTRRQAVLLSRVMMGANGWGGKPNSVFSWTFTEHILFSDSVTTNDRRRAGIQLQGKLSVSVWVAEETTV